jgi:hypothetical protein
MDVLMDGLSSELRVGRDQCITVWYFNIIMTQDVRLTQNDKFHVMFDMYRAKRKLALTIIVLDNPCSETPAHMIVGFKLAKIKTDPTRFIPRCAHATCKWRIHASVLQDGKTVMV